MVTSILLVPVLGLASMFLYVSPAHSATTNLIISPHHCVSRLDRDRREIRRLSSGLLNASRTRSIFLICNVSEGIPLTDACETAEYRSSRVAAVVSLRPPLSGTTSPQIWLFKTALDVPQVTIEPIEFPLASATDNVTITEQDIVGVESFTVTLDAAIDCNDLETISFPSVMIKLPPFGLVTALAYRQR